jgi:hypothetical protein
VIEFLPGNTEAREEAEWIVNRLVENDVRTLPDDFLAYHQATLSPYRGMRGLVVETDEYPSVEACAGQDRIRPNLLTIFGIRDNRYRLPLILNTDHAYRPKPLDHSLTSTPCKNN